MEKTQSFRLIGAAETATIPIKHVDGQDVVYWESIKQVFPGVECVKNGDDPVPCFIKHVPDVALNVVISTVTDRVRSDSSTGAPSMVPIAALDFAQTVGGTHARASQALKRASKKTREADDQASQQENDPKMAYVIKLLEASDTKQEEMRHLLKQALDKQEEMKQLASKYHQEMKQSQKAADDKQEEILQLQKQAREQQEAMKQQALDHHEEIKQLQIRTLEQLAVLQSRVQAVLTQTYELHEYPIPRLFVVLPQDSTRWDALNPFSNKFRLYFLCECGEHTKSMSIKTGIPHHIHFAKHEGYEIARPTEFFQQYGSYVLTILKMLKYGVTVAGIVMPAFSQMISPDGFDQSIVALKLLQDTIVPGMDQVINSMDSLSMDHGEGIKGVTGQVENKEALEGADLRKLETFLKDQDGNKVLGNLYRTVTDEGHVKWVCMDHYRENYNTAAVEIFRRAVESLGGTFDENNGVGRVRLKSRVSANQFYLALGNARSVHELDIIFDWACTGTDLQVLEDALRKSAVAILHVDLRRFRPNLLNGKLSSIRTRYEILYRIMNPPSMKAIHIVLPEDIIKLSNFTPKRPAHLRKLSFEVVVGRSIRIHANMLETGSTVTTLYLWDNSIGRSGARAPAEALETHLTLTTLQAKGWIKPNGAQALAEVLKTNSTVTTLNMSEDRIEDSGAQALAEALKTNKTVNTLILNINEIGDNGAQALAEALKANKALTILNLENNSIGPSGAQALAEALKTNKTLATLNLSYNQIGGSGAQALAEALKASKTLTTLYLRGNKIGDHGAQALAEARSINAAVHIRV
ncbi:hypothetical protein BGZ68_006760 [Mortierella alpina]|nr:hypothetical protein BGZ68_006760 [Mortierella alpina]